MYYKKYFSGSVDATTTTTQYYMGLDKIATGTSFKTGHIKNRSDVIGNAIVSTLKDIGYPNAYWDSTSGYVFMDKTNGLCGFYLSVQSSNLYINLGVYTSNYSYISAITLSSSIGYASKSWNGTSSSPFSATGNSAASYAFYITILGEPKGIFQISIGNYSSPSAETSQILLCVGIDKRDDSAVFGCDMGGTLSNYALYTVAYDNVTSNSAYNFGVQNNTLTINNQLVVLIPLFLSKGYLFINNAYLNPGISTRGFYKIGNDTYYVGNYWMTKCITDL